MSVLEVENLSASTEGVSILRSLDFTVEDGSTTAILGSNGAGKTTTFRTIVGLNDASEGHVNYQGTDILNLPAHERKRQGITFCPEDRGLIPLLTVRENVELFMWGETEPPDEDEAERRFEAALEFFPDMEEFADRPAGKLSGGQQQMTAVARALVAEPDLLLLDEPFEGLAPTIRTSLKSSLIENLDDDVTLFVSESEINHIADFVDNIHIIDRGEIVATDLTYEELRSNDELMGLLGG